METEEFYNLLWSVYQFSVIEFAQLRAIFERLSTFRRFLKPAECLLNLSVDPSL
jgi:hypothetical protein